MKRLSADVTEHVSMHVTAQVAVLCMHLHVHPFTHLHLDLFIFEANFAPKVGLIDL